MENDEFHKLVKKMDLGIQISYTETFNIVTADFVNNDKLIIVSKDINWMPNFLKTSTFDYKSVINKIIFVYKLRNIKLIKLFNRYKLKKYNKEAKKEWKKLFN
jgi:hypothetical protein